MVFRPSVRQRQYTSLGDNKDEIHIIPGSYNVEETLKLSGTRIYMKSGKKLARLKEFLSTHAQELEVMAVSNCGMENETIYRNLNDIDENSSYLTVVIMYTEEPCPGKPVYKERDGKKIKVCTYCSFPHKAESYDMIVQRLK